MMAQAECQQRVTALRAKKIILVLLWAAMESSQRKINPTDH